MEPSTTAGTRGAEDGGGRSERDPEGQLQTLFTPWRFRYVSRMERSEGCFLCAAAADEGGSKTLVVHLAAHHLVMLNRYPYTNGHVMVAPREHLSDPDAAGEEAQAEFWPLVLRTKQALMEVYRPDGINMGINLGSAAGAGVPTHYHFHLVPRWVADTNFMTSIGNVRTIPEDLEDTWEKLHQAFRRSDSDG